MGRLSPKVIITGMHRSGTSLVAGLLQHCGLHLGDDLLSGRGDNPRGHFEDRTFIDLNERVLRHSGGNWRRPPPSIRTDAGLRGAMRAFLATWPNDRPVGWKDPRCCLTLGAWREALGHHPLFVVSVLRPHESIAQSLRERNGFPLGRGRALSTQYAAVLAEHLRAFSPTEYLLTPSSAYFSDWRSELARVCEPLGLSLPVDTSGIEEFIDPSLRHYT